MTTAPRMCGVAIVLGGLVPVLSAGLWAQGMSALAGTWILDPSTRDGRHLLAGMEVVGPNPSTLIIEVSASRVLLRKGSTILDREAYRFDGSETDVGGDRIGTAAVIDGRLVLTIRRTRPDAGINVFKDIYSVTGGTMTVERQLSVIQPDGTIRENIASFAHTVTYRKN